MNQFTLRIRPVPVAAEPPPGRHERLLRHVFGLLVRAADDARRADDRSLVPHDELAERGRVSSPGLFDQLQRQWRVTVCGPTNLLAHLNSLQMGFRTLAIQQRSSEVWKVLGTVKSEFGKFAEVLANTKRQLQTVANTIDQAEVRTRQIERKLKDVEALPGAETQESLQLEEDRPAGDLVRLPKV